MKVVINRCHGGFGLSNKAFEMLLDKKGIEYERVPAKYPIRTDLYDYYTKGHVGEDEHFLMHYSFTEDRSDSDLITVVEELGIEANSWAAELAIVDIPDDVEWTVEEYDGLEWVAEVHRTWS